MAGLIRGHDWAATPLGAIEGWSSRLRLMVELVLASPQVASLVCGPQRVLVYNDAAARLYGAHHPAALGRPLPRVFPEGWAAVAPLYARAFAGEVVQVVARELDTRGEGEARDIFDATLTPVRDDAGLVAFVQMSGQEVGSRVRVETALRASETRFRALVTATSYVVYRMSPDWGEMRQLDGRNFLADTAAPSATWLDTYIHPDDQPLVQATIQKAIATKGIFELEHRVRRADGSLGWTLSRAIPLLDADGEIEEWFGAASDVTARKDAEERLRASEELLRQFGEASSDVLWIREASSLQWLYLAPAFETIYGLRREAALAGDNYRTWSGMIVAEDRARALTAIERVRAGERVTFEYRVKRPVDGEVRWLRDTDFPLLDEAGRVRRIGGIGQDVTALKQVEAALRAETERLRTLLEGMPQLVWRADAGGLWTWSGPQWRDYTRQSQAESRGWGWLDVVHPDDHAAVRRAWAEAQAHGRLDVEYRLRRADDGAWRWHATRSVPVREVYGPDTTRGRILEWLGTTTDIEDLKRLQGQQEVLIAELQHRTRNLLAVVRSVAGRSLDPSPGLDEYGARLAALSRVQGFLSRSPAYRVPLAELVQAELAAAGDGAAARVAVAGPPVALPGASVQAVALALHELATNAVKHGALAQASGRLAVRWRVEAEGGPERRLVIDWRESGVAMPPGPPARQGYGSELITQALPYQLGARTELTFTPKGVHCRIALPARMFKDGE